jgi:hypothetical protein
VSQFVDDERYAMIGQLSAERHIPYKIERRSAGC